MEAVWAPFLDCNSWGFEPDIVLMLTKVSEHEHIVKKETWQNKKQKQTVMISLNRPSSSPEGENKGKK